MNGQALLAGGLASCADKIVVGSRDAGAPVLGVPAEQVADPEVLRSLIARFATVHGAAPWQPACSMWTQCYFGTLLPPAMALLLADEAPPAMALADVRVVLCPETCIPLAFHAAPMTGRLPLQTRSLTPLLCDHLPFIVETVRRVGDLSAHLLWENASWPMTWALAVLSEEHPGLQPAIAALLDDAGETAPQRRMLARARAVALEGQPFRRRLCCLRDRMPGLVTCGDLCPRRIGTR